MKIMALAIALLLVLLSLALPAFAANPDHVAQLIETRSCTDCDLRDADLRGLNLSSGDLSNSDLRDANLMAVNFTQANLSNTNLSGAIMYGVDLTDANLYRARARYAFLDSARVCRTTIPSGVQSDRDCP